MQSVDVKSKSTYLEHYQHTILKILNHLIIFLSFHTVDC